MTAVLREDVIGARLVAAGKISPSDVEKALVFQQEMGKGTAGVASLPALRPASGRLGAVLVRMGALSEEALLPHLSEQTDISLLASDALPGGAEVAQAVTLLALTSLWWQAREAVPFMRANQLWIAAKDPLDRELNELVAHAAGARSFQFCWARSNDMARLQQLLRDAERGGRARVGNLGDANYLRELA